MRRGVSDRPLSQQPGIGGNWHTDLRNYRLSLKNPVKAGKEQKQYAEI